MSAIPSPLTKKRSVGKSIFFELTDEAKIQSMTYPLSVDYVGDWTAVRAMSEFIANAIDEDPTGFSVTWENGCLIIEDNGQGMSEYAHIMGHTTKANDNANIGQHGEGFKIGSLVLARNKNIGRILFETTGYSFEPKIVRANLLSAQMRQGDNIQAPELLAVDFYPSDRTSGTRITIECDESFLEKVKSRFLHFRPNWDKNANPKGEIIVGENSKIYVGGVLVQDNSPYHFSYNLPLSAAKRASNRDRNMIDQYVLRQTVSSVWRNETDNDRLALWIDGYFKNSYTEYDEKMPFYDLSPAQRLLFRKATVKALGTSKLFYNNNPANARDKIKIAKTKGYKQVSVKKNEYRTKQFLSHIGVKTLSDIVKDKPVKRPRVKTRRNNTKPLAIGETRWATPSKVSAVHKSSLDRAISRLKLLYGAKNVCRIRFYTATNNQLGWPNGYYGFYDPNAKTIGLSLGGGHSEKFLVNVLTPLIAQHMAHHVFKLCSSYNKKSIEQLYAEQLAELLSKAQVRLYQEDAMPTPVSTVKNKVLKEQIITLVGMQMKAKGHKDAAALEVATAVELRSLQNLLAGKMVNDLRELSAACQELGLDEGVMYVACRAAHYLSIKNKPKHIYGGSYSNYQQSVRHIATLGTGYKELSLKLSTLGYTAAKDLKDDWYKPVVELLELQTKDLKK